MYVYVTAYKAMAAVQITPDSSELQAFSVGENACANKSTMEAQYNMADVSSNVATSKMWWFTEKVLRKILI